MNIATSSLVAVFGMLALSSLTVACGSSDPESRDEEGEEPTTRSSAAASSSAASTAIAGAAGGGAALAQTETLYAEETAPAVVNASTMLIPGLRLDFTLSSDAIVDMSTVGSVWWDSGRCTIKFVIDGQPSATDDAEVGCPAAGTRCMGFQSYYPFSAIRRVKGLTAGAHHIEVQLGSENASVCSVMAEPDAVPTRLYVTTTQAVRSTTDGVAK